MDRDTGQGKPAVSNPAKNPDTISTSYMTMDTFGEIPDY